ncbi:MAG: hypothetical protein KGL39_59660, partial [Patescibacteria group bacterium]|nr:hypothetical protein [Patescibacteria group bacterium]
PTHQGTCTINGQQYYISAWVKESQKDGSRFFSLAFKPKMARDHAGAPENPPAPSASQEQFDDSIPF